MREPLSLALSINTIFNFAQRVRAKKKYIRAQNEKLFSQFKLNRNCCYTWSLIFYSFLSVSNTVVFARNSNMLPHENCMRG